MMFHSCKQTVKRLFFKRYLLYFKEQNKYVKKFLTISNNASTRLSETAITYFTPPNKRCQHLFSAKTPFLGNFIIITLNANALSAVFGQIADVFSSFLGLTLL